MNRAIQTRVELFEDYLCRPCADLNAVVADEISACMKGDHACILELRPVNMLDKLSTVPGYSTRAGAMIVGLPIHARVHLRQKMFRLVRSDDPPFKGASVEELASSETSEELSVRNLKFLTEDPHHREAVQANVTQLSHLLRGPDLAVPTVVIDGRVIPATRMAEQLKAALTKK